VNQSEIQGGLAAEKKADAPAVRAFARLMVLDHMGLESQLAAIATENGVQLPSGPSEQAKQEMASLQNISGSEFDTKYMQHMVQGHEHVIQKFKSEEGQAQARPVETVVAGALPILQQHLALAQAVQSGIKNQAPGTVGSTNKRN
jgi:putative membrane protein